MIDTTRYVMPHKIYLWVILILLISCTCRASAQNAGLKTNLIYDATATVNLGLEFGLAPKWSLDISGNYNSWSKDIHTKWKHCIIQPEARYWFCDRFSRHFLGIHVHAGAFNIGGIKNQISFLGSDFSLLSNHRFQGYAIGAGAAYGYAFILGRHWNLEFEVGVGYAYLDYEKYECIGCGRRNGDGIHHYVGPTKAAINLVYLF